MSRKRSRRLAKYNRLKNDALRQKAQKVSIGVLASIGVFSTLQPTIGEAAVISNAMSDLPVSFESLINERERIKGVNEAKLNVKEAADALVQAEQDVQSARQDKQDAEKGLNEAQKNLESAKVNLQKISQQLANAQVESAQRTREAIAAQQAVADFAPQVWSQKAVVQSVQGRQQAVQAKYEQLGRELGHLSNERSDLEARIRQAWDSVGYAQNRMGDVMAMVNRTKEIVPEQSAKEEKMQAYDNQLAELESEVEDAESLLDELNSQLDELQEKCEAAEAAEHDARELVKDLQEQHADGERDLKESEQSVVETTKWNEDAARELESAENNLTLTQDWKTKADYELAHFGEGKGLGAGFEYYSWHGAGMPNGHQLYQPIEFYITDKKWDLSLTTGRLNSDTGLSDGHVNGWTDTTLGIAYKSNHKINDVHYSLDINVPTGKENAHQNAMMADNLARFNSFSEGWQFTPELEVTHRFTERDSITGRLSYKFRGGYQYRRGDELIEWGKVLSISPKLSDVIPASTRSAVFRKIEGTEYISPSNQFSQDMEYRHIGEKKQLRVSFQHINASHAKYQSELNYYISADGTYHGKSILYDDGYNYDGEDWILQVFGSQDIDRKNSLQYYVVGNYQAADTGGTHRYYGGLGWTHQFDKKQSGYVLLNYGETHGQSYNWRTGKYDSGRIMKAIILGYDYRLNDTSNLQTKLERYNINGSSTDSYYGWKLSLMWNKSF